MPREPEEIANEVITRHARGQSQREIALELGVTRKRVRGILERIGEQRTAGHSALPAAPEKRACTLDAYAGFIAAQIALYPNITAVRLHEELGKYGFTGGYTIVKDHLRAVRPQPKKAPVERFETAPGEQGQQDWSPYTIPFTQSGPTAHGDDHIVRKPMIVYGFVGPLLRLLANFIESPVHVVEVDVGCQRAEGASLRHPNLPTGLQDLLHQP
jgi:hypothetical protein